MSGQESLVQNRPLRNLLKILNITIDKKNIKPVQNL